MGAGYGPNIITDGLVFHLDAGNKRSYPGSGSNWYDLSKKKSLGTTNGTLTYSTNKVIFNDTQYIQMNINPQSLGVYNASYTCEAVVSFSNLTGDNMIFGGVTTGTRAGWHLGTRNSSFYFGHYGSDTSAGTATIGTKYHIVWTFEKGISSNIAKILINTVNISGAGANIGTYIGTNPVLIGAGYNTTGTRFAGDFYYARIYNRLLSQSEIVQNFNATKSRYGL